jgi:uncharacterized UPF0160 family protein
MSRIPRSCGTHDGTFHADEVTACALLNLFNLIDDDKIIRTRDPVRLAQCEYVCDVGGSYDPQSKLFDHHQADYNGSFSSAGMILLYLRENGLIGHAEYDFLNKSLILGVDDHDNGRDVAPYGVCTYSHIISNYTPVDHECSPPSQDRAFMQAFYFARDHLDRALRRHRYVHSCRAQVADAMKTDEQYLLFDRSIPWMESFFELDGENHPAKFIVMPAGNHWKVRGIPPSFEEHLMVRIPLPQEWAGLLDEEFKAVSGMEGAIFCHKGRFISVWQTYQDALCAVRHVLDLHKELR